MNRLITMLLLYFVSIVAFAQKDSLKIAEIHEKIISLENFVVTLRRENLQLKKQNESQDFVLSNLKSKQALVENNVQMLADNFDVEITATNSKIDDDVKMLNSSILANLVWAICGILLAIILLVIVYFVLRKKINIGTTTIDKIRSAQEGLELAQKAMQEESVKLDSKLVELLDKKIESTPTPVVNEQSDHTLALKVADEIVRIETNLSRMDTSVKGYKQLAKAVERIRTNFLANGYEIVEMLGKPYNEGMKVVANFVSDDTLAEGEQKITGIIKPQINYKGKMIQSAQITVSQNL